MPGCRYMKRILLVGEDQPLWWELPQSSYWRAKHWCAEVAAAGHEALALSQQQEFDAVVADFKLPDMDGIRLLDELMIVQPRVARIVLSELEDLEGTARCVSRIHRHLLKPCDASTLVRVLGNALSQNAWVPSQKAQRLLSQMHWIPSPPRQYFEIVEEMASPSASLDSIGERISLDPPLAAKILQLSNSAVLGLQLEITRLAEAVGYLGFEVTRSLVLLAHAFAEFEKFVPRYFCAEALWAHSASVARLAREIAGEQGLAPETEEQAYCAGLLHDLGKIVLAANVPQDFSQALSRARESGIELHRMESELLGANHGEIGACLLAIWGLPTPLVEAVGFHHSPSLSSDTLFSPLAAVHVANAWAHQIPGKAETGVVTGLDRNYLNRIGMAESLDGWRDHGRNDAEVSVANPR
jgi:HD-like signal output (HDOD) protein